MGAVFGKRVVPAHELRQKVDLAMFGLVGVFALVAERRARAGSRSDEHEVTVVATLARVPAGAPSASVSPSASVFQSI